MHLENTTPVGGTEVLLQRSSNKKAIMQLAMKLYKNTVFLFDFFRTCTVTNNILVVLCCQVVLVYSVTLR